MTSDTTSLHRLTGSDAPERTEVRVGVMPLTDCASVVMAAHLGFDRRHGVRLVPQRAASWAAVRDRLVAGEIDLAHALYGLVYGVQMGIGGLQQDMAVLMTLDHNGQGITLSRRLAQLGATDLAGLRRLMDREPRRYTFAQTFPTGTHAMWLYHWLSCAGIHPLRDCRIVTVPPPQMVSAMRLGQVDGFSVGEPWNHAAILDGVGVSVATSQQIWPGHPEKVLATTAAWADRHPHTCRAVTMALLEASRWLDASVDNRTLAAEVLTASGFVDAGVPALLPRLLGRYQDGLGRCWDDPHPVRFHADGAVNFPYLSDGMWFLTQYRRWGLLDHHPDYAAIARRVHRIDSYRDAARALGVPLPASPMRSSRLLDGQRPEGRVWDGSDPAAYADAFEIRSLSATTGA